MYDPADRLAEIRREQRRLTRLADRVPSWTPEYDALHRAWRALHREAWAIRLGLLDAASRN